MPITIDYNQFQTIAENLAIFPQQPVDYSPLIYDVNNLYDNDRIIIFSGLPNGLQIDSPPGTTQPFDSVFIDVVQWDDYAYLSGANNTWSNGLSNIYAAYTSGGFWALGEIGGNAPGIFLTGLSGDADSSILDIEFTGVDIPTTTYDEYLPAGPLDRMATYIFNIPAAYGAGVTFNQVENYSWYPINIRANNGAVVITGSAFNGTTGSISLSSGFSGSLSWINNALVTGVDFLGPAPFNVCPFSGGYGWASTTANEILSEYTIISSNAGNSGVAIIQLNEYASNGQKFTDLIPPLRKLYINFVD